jgi:hypothetical protein
MERQYILREKIQTWKICNIQYQLMIASTLCGFEAWVRGFAKKFENDRNMTRILSSYHVGNLIRNRNSQFVALEKLHRNLKKRI